MYSAPFVIVLGELQRRDGTLNVIAERFTPLRAEGAPRRRTTSVMGTAAASAG